MGYQRNPYVAIYMVPRDKDRVEEAAARYSQVTRQDYMRAALALGVCVLEKLDPKEVESKGLAGALVLDGRRLAAAMMGVGAGMSGAVLGERALALLSRFFPRGGDPGTLDLSAGLEEWSLEG